jgi:hypothetical protein
MHVQRPDERAEAGLRSARIVAAPASFAQQGIWFAEQMRPGLYGLPMLLTIDARLEQGAVESALGALLRRHPTLRASFRIDSEGTLVQEVDDAGDGSAEFELELEDIRGGGAHQVDAVVRDRVRQLAGDPLDLAAGPLLRARMFRLPGDRTALLLFLHHISCDGWGFAELLADLEVLYRTGPGADYPAARADPDAFFEFARSQREAAAEGEFAEGVSFWEERLRDMPTLRFPDQSSEAPTRSFAGDLLRFRVPGDLADTVTPADARRGITPFVLYLSAWLAVLRAWTGQTDIVVGCPTAGRPDPRLEHVVGCFVNVVPVRVDLGAAGPLDELVPVVRDRVLEALRYRDVPYEEVARRVATPGRPVVQALFAFQNFPGVPDSFSRARCRVEEVHLGTAHFDVSLLLEPASDGFDALLEYSTDVISHTTARAIASDYVTSSVEGRS